MLTETYTSDELVNTHDVSGYAMYSRMRTIDGEQSRGGAVMLVLDDGSWKHREIHRSPEGSRIESVTVELTGVTESFWATVAYVRPGIMVDATELASALPVSKVPGDGKWIIGTDMNAHHELWDAFMEEDARGEMVVNFMIENDLQCGNDPDKPTRSAVNQKKAAEVESCPDVIMTRNLEINNFCIGKDAHSDHNWLTFDIDGVAPGKATKRRYWNLKKANWEAYSWAVDVMIKREGGRISIDKLSNIMYAAMRQHVPKTTHKSHSPLWTERMTEALKEYEEADARYRAHPTEENLWATKQAKHNMERVHKEERLKVFWEKYHRVSKTKEVWKLLRNNVGRAKASTNSVIVEETTARDGNVQRKEHKSDREKARAFVRKFAQVSKRTGPEAKKVKVGGTLHHLTMDEFRVALRKTPRGKAVGPDELPIEAVDHLTQWAQTCLLEAMNWSYIRGDVPMIWRRGWIVPVLKPNKNAADIGSYRPVTLTSQVSKLMERMIARRVIYAIEGKMHHYQYGFRAGLSTTDALSEIVEEVVTAFDT
eukprot:PhF_6_TR14385/c0_g1_i1/m.22998